MKKKYLAVLSSTALAVVFATALSSSTAHAADRDLYDTQTKTKTAKENWVYNYDIDITNGNYGYELNGKVYDVVKFGTNILDSLHKGTNPVEAFTSAVANDALVDQKTTEEMDQYKEGQEDLVVTEISAIDENGITVVFEAVTEAQENVTIEVKDPAGEIVEVKPLNLEIGDTEVTFDFATVYAADKLPLGNWTVVGKTYDTAADAAVAKVVAATNVVELWEALQSDYFEGATQANIEAYDTAITAAIAAGKLDTVSDVNKVIADVNNTGSEAEAEAAVVKKVADATNVLELLNALKDGEFERVNDAWITAYSTANVTLDNSTTEGMLALTATNYFGETTGATIEEVQAAIDTVNGTKVGDSVTAAEGDLDLAKIATARGLVNEYIAEDEEDQPEVKQPLLNRLTLHEAVVNVTLANTNAKLNNALVALDKLTNDFDIATVNANELTSYRTAITTAGTAAKDTAAKIQGLITTTNTTAETTAVDAVAAIDADTTTAELKVLLVTLADRSAFASDAFDLDTVNDALLEDYKAAMLADPAPAMTTAAEIQTIITTANDPAAALTTLVDTTSALDDADKLLVALKAKTLDLTVVDANKAAYFADIAGIKTAAATDADAVQAVVDATNARLSFNADGSLAALTNFAIATNDTSYINLSSAAKAEVVALVKAEKPAAGYATNALVTTEISDQISARGTLISNVNTAADIVAMNTALTALEYAPYEALSSAEKLVVAEAFIANFPMDNADTPAKVPYTTIAGIQAAIDVAIAK